MRVCVCRVAVVPILLLLASLPLSAQSRQTSSNPPTELHRIGDHWTAWYPPDPATYPPGSAVHTIVRGDTLWDLATRYYGNPYLWPQLWESNTWIRDSHWIYAGDTLLIQGEASGSGIPTSTSVSEDFGFDPDDQGAGPVMTTDSGALGPPLALATEADLYCWGYLGRVDEPLPNVISAFEDTELKYIHDARSQDIGVATNEIIYIKGGVETGLAAGETYLVVRPSELVLHPESEAVLGRHYDFRGQVRILCLNDDDTATAIVTQACSDLLLGDRLKPLPQLPIPLARLSPMANACTPPTLKSTGHIVNAKDYRYALGEGALVQINLGRDQFVEPGTFLTVFRESPVSGNPNEILGEIGVLTADASSATGRIVRMRYAMRVGDQVELK